MRWFLTGWGRLFLVSWAAWAICSYFLVRDLHQGLWIYDRSPYELTSSAGLAPPIALLVLRWVVRGFQNDAMKRPPALPSERAKEQWPRVLVAAIVGSALLQWFQMTRLRDDVESVGMDISDLESKVDDLALRVSDRN